MALFVVVSTDKVYVDFGTGVTQGFTTGQVFDADPTLPSMLALLHANPPPIIAFVPSPPAPSTTSPQTIVRTAANLGVVSGDVGKLFTNGGATGTVRVTLPASTPGLFFDFLNEGGGWLFEVKPTGTDTITQGGLVTTPTTGLKSTSSGGDGVHCTCPVAGKWYFNLFSGSNWTNT